MGGDPLVDEVVAAPDNGPQCTGLLTERRQDGELVDLSRRYSAITSASPGSSLAPETTSDSRHAFMALGATGTTGWPASSKASTNLPSGRSIATGTWAAEPSFDSF